jgi:hypothetical protein
MLRRMAVLAGGLALMASVGLTGAGTASAASPALKVKPGTIWTIEFNHGGPCEIDTFNADQTFTSNRFNDTGTWNLDRKTITMVWTGGFDTGLNFNGTLDKPLFEYSGKFTGLGKDTGQLVRGPIQMWHSADCEPE